MTIGIDRDTAQYLAETGQTIKEALTMRKVNTVEVGDTVYYQPSRHVDARDHWSHGTVVRLTCEGTVAHVQTYMGGSVKAHVSHLVASK